MSNNKDFDLFKLSEDHDELRAAAEVVAPGSERLMFDVRCRAHPQAGCVQPSLE